MASPTSPTIASRTSSSPVVDLRHMNSSSLLPSPSKAHRASSPVQPRLASGSRSPNSIPSSPTSVHSSSSAIFERDIEPFGLASPTSPSNPHRIARAKNTEPLEQGVPAVLDSALSLLVDSDPSDAISVEAPIVYGASSSSGFASPIDSYRSRSPSPSIIGATGFGRNSLLLNIPTSSSPPSVGLGHLTTPTPGTIHPQVSPSRTAAIPIARPHPAVSTEMHEMATPTSAYFSTASSGAGSLPGSPSTTNAMRLPASSSPPVNSHPPSPISKASKRLSFMSYNDLLASTPANTVPLAVLTTDASAFEPPPHISALTLPISPPSHSGVTSAATSLRGRDRNSTVISPSLNLMGDAGGEWERQGMGLGLEERLELDPVHVH